jgi:hypothetical protein
MISYAELSTQEQEVLARFHSMGNQMVIRVLERSIDNATRRLVTEPDEVQVRRLQGEIFGLKNFLEVAAEAAKTVA